MPSSDARLKGDTSRNVARKALVTGRGRAGRSLSWVLAAQAAAHGPSRYTLCPVHQSLALDTAVQDDLGTSCSSTPTGSAQTRAPIAKNPQIPMTVTNGLVTSSHDTDTTETTRQHGCMPSTQLPGAVLQPAACTHPSRRLHAINRARTCAWPPARPVGSSPLPPRPRSPLPRSMSIVARR